MTALAVAAAILVVGRGRGDFLAESVHVGRKRAVTRLYLYSGNGIKTEIKENHGKLQLW